MITRTRLLSTIAAFMLACTAGHAGAGETSTVDTSGCKVPSYRHDWETNEESGEVVLAVQFDAKGKLKAVKLVESSGWPDLDFASLRSLRQCVFKNTATTSQSWETVRYIWLLK
ncbi:MAG: TonB family protein [Burkholderiaceae bacterium]|nr:TonB family protein [Burkholderiaceae bacterium]